MTTVRDARRPLRLVSADGQRHYRIDVTAPADPAPPGGWPVVYLLDGAAALDVVRETPVRALVVTIAHDADADATKAARAYDYTPPSPDGAPRRDPRVPAWPAGGADGFLDLIDHAVRPAVLRDWPADPTRQVLAGHSYGGLCVLHALCTQRGYAGYVCASPSVWWHDQAILASVMALRDVTLPPASIRLLVGEREAWHAHATGQDGTAQSRRGGHATAPAAQALADGLATLPGLDVAFVKVPGGTHATMAATLVREAIRFTAALA